MHPSAARPPSSAVYSEVATNEEDESDGLLNGSAAPTRRALKSYGSTDSSTTWSRLAHLAILASACIAPAAVLLLVLLTLTGFITISFPSSSPAPSSLLLLLPPPPPPEPLPAYLPSNGICILARCYDAQYSFIPTFISLLTFNAHPPLIFFVNTEKEGNLTTLHRILADANAHHNLSLAHPLDISWDQATAVFPQMDSVPSYGYVHTDLAMTTLADAHPECTYVTITNSDNMYSRGWLDKVELQIAAGYELIGWSFVSHHEKPHLSEKGEGTWEDLRYKWVRAEFLPSEIDLGASMLKLSLWKRLGLGFTQYGRQYGFAGADGRHIMKLTAENVKRILMRGTYLVHQ